MPESCTLMDWVSLLIWISVSLLASTMLVCALCLLFPPKRGPGGGGAGGGLPIDPEPSGGLERALHHPSEHGVYSHLDDKVLEETMRRWMKEDVNASS
jgi:hypothetical protein